MNEVQPAILFVDDTADTRELIEFSLRQDGFQVTTAQTGDDGLALAQANSYALIILDIGLPDRDGLELCREIRRFDDQTPILLYTAFADLLDREEAKTAGAQGCLRKPEDTARLASVIHSLIDPQHNGERQT
ncbi:MAG: response regulator [Pyrinomonadaceae bacterium]|jgi:DNA-binding response OmpR family regulator|nr:response regulator [Pyrinomonadaceae bacterium]